MRRAGRLWTDVVEKSLASSDSELEILEGTVSFLRRVAAVLPRTRKSLAATLHRLSIHLAVLGRHEDALAASEESVALYRQVLHRRPATVGPMYVAALNRLAYRLLECDRPHDALAVAEQVVQIERRLGPGRERQLANALHDLGIYLGHLDRPGDGLLAADEAVQRYRKLTDLRDDEIADAVSSRDNRLKQLEEAGMVVLGPHPLCRECQRVSGGLVAARHRQVHLRVNGRQACVDQGMVDVITALWAADCDTRSSCEDSEGRAQVVPDVGRTARAEEVLTGMGLDVANERGVLHFPLPQRTH